MAFSWESRKKLENYVSRRLGVLQEQYVIKDRPSARAQLARLRRLATKDPGGSLETWDFEFGGLPEELAGKGSAAPTTGEYAAHLAFTLYAVHQQSQDREMYCRTRAEAGELHGLGHAANQLAYLGRKNEQGEQLEQGEMPRRFVALVTAETMEEVGHYARQLVQQLRGESIPLDYGRLAGQLYEFGFPALRNRVRLEWGREFSQWRAPQQESESKEA